MKHGALLDAELLAQVYIELNGGRQIGLALAAESIVSLSSDAEQASPTTKAAKRTSREPRPHSASAEELARHKQFVEKIENAMWTR